jgi:large subunit ribosomal protein L25
MIGQNLRASEIPLSGSLKLVSPADQVIAHCVAMKAEEVAPAAEAGPEAVAATPAEPEVIKKGKKEEDVAAEPEKGKKKG